MDTLPDAILHDILRRVPRRGQLRIVSTTFRRIIDASHTPEYMQKRRIYFCGLLRHVCTHALFLESVVDIWLHHSVIWVGVDTFMHYGVDWTRMRVSIVEMKVDTSQHFQNIRRMSHCVGIYARGVNVPFSTRHVKKTLMDVVEFKLSRRGMLVRNVENAGSLLILSALYLQHVRETVHYFSVLPNEYFSRHSELGKVEYTDCKKQHGHVSLWVSARANRHSLELGEYLYVYPFHPCCHCTQPWSGDSRTSKTTVKRVFGSQHIAVLKAMALDVARLVHEMSCASATSVERVSRAICASRTVYHVLLPLLVRASARPAG